MGCHAWYYQKVKSFNKEALNYWLNEFIESEFQSFVYKTTRNKYAQTMLEDAQDMIKHPEYVEDHFVEWAKKHSTFEACAATWDKYHEKYVRIMDKKKAFIESDDMGPDDFIEILRDLYDREDSVNMNRHNGEYYIHIMFDTAMRCYAFSEERLDSYDKMINFLSNCHENMIVQYKTDEDGNRVVVKGLTEELKEYLKELYKDNDIYVEFG